MKILYCRENLGHSDIFNISKQKKVFKSGNEYKIKKKAFLLLFLTLFLKVYYNYSLQKLKLLLTIEVLASNNLFNIKLHLD